MRICIPNKQKIGICPILTLGKMFDGFRQVFVKVFFHSKEKGSTSSAKVSHKFQNV